MKIKFNFNSKFNIGDKVMLKNKYFWHENSVNNDVYIIYEIYYVINNRKETGIFYKLDSDETSFPNISEKMLEKEFKLSKDV